MASRAPLFRRSVQLGSSRVVQVPPSVLYVRRVSSIARRANLAASPRPPATSSLPKVRRVKSRANRALLRAARGTSDVLIVAPVPTQRARSRRSAREPNTGTSSINRARRSIDRQALRLSDQGGRFRETASQDHHRAPGFPVEWPGRACRGRRFRLATSRRRAARRHHELVEMTLHPRSTPRRAGKIDISPRASKTTCIHILLENPPRHPRRPDPQRHRPHEVQHHEVGRRRLFLRRL